MIYPNIRNLREDRDLKQRELADVLHVSQNTYSQYETGIIELTAEKLILLSKIYNASVDYLLGLYNKTIGGHEHWEKMIAEIDNQKK